MEGLTQCVTGLESRFDRFMHDQLGGPRPLASEVRGEMTSGSESASYSQVNTSAASSSCEDFVPKTVRFPMSTRGQFERLKELLSDEAYETRLVRNVLFEFLFDNCVCLFLHLRVSFVCFR